MTDQNNQEYRPKIMKKIVGILLLAVGSVFIAATLFYAVKDFPLWVFGKHTEAEVTKTWFERVDEVKERDEGMQKYHFYISYQFTTANGKVINATSRTSETEWSGMWDGLDIDIIYFPLYPKLNRQDDSNWAFFLACSYIPLFAICFIGVRVGWYMLTSP